MRLEGVMVSFTIDGIPAKHKETRFSRKGWAYSGCAKEKEELHQKILSVYKQAMSYQPIILKATYWMPIPKSFSKKKTKFLIDMEREGQPVPHPKKPDTDAMTKILKDALEKIAYYNDSQVFDESFKKFYSTYPRTEVEIYEYPFTEFGEFSH